jgi:hypothetical protein
VAFTTVMDRNIERKERLGLALRPVEKPSTIEEVLEEVSTHGVLRGPVDWVFPAWMLYVEYAVQKIAETFPLSEEERGQLLHFRDTLKRLLMEAQRQAKEKLTTLYKAVAEGTYRVEGKRLYVPNGTWMYIGANTPQFKIHGVGAKAYFPDVLKLPRERLELFQLGWRASDEGELNGQPYMNTTQPWQVFAWTATRYGELYIRIDTVNLTRKGISTSIRITARSWRQKRSKDEAISLVAEYLRRGEWAPLLTMWLGDGKAGRWQVLHGIYQLVVAAKEPWRLGNSISPRETLVATGREAFERLREAASVYDMLLDVLQSNKWIVVKLATDDGFRAVFKLNTEKRSIDVLREAFGQNGVEASAEQPGYVERNSRRRGAVAVAGVVMYLHLVSGKGGSLLARCYVRDVGEALAIAGRLESAGLRPNIVKTGHNYMVYIATADLLRLAERDEAVRKAIAQYLAEKVKNGTPKQREAAEKILTRHPFFQSLSLSDSLKLLSL